MAYNVVVKGKSVALVDKHRDHDGKVKEKYLLGLGVMTDSEFKSFRSQVHELAQEDRVNYCMRSKRVVEVSSDIPRTKAPTGRIPEEPKPKQTVKKARKANKAKRIPAHERIMWETRPWLKRGYLTTEEQRREKDKPIKPKTRPQMTNAEIDERIEKIKKDINFSKSVLKQKQNKDTSRLARYEQQRLHEEIEYHKSVVSAGNEAIKILRSRK